MTYLTYNQQTKEVLALFVERQHASLFAESMNCTQTGSAIFGDYNWTCFDDIRDTLLAENVRAYIERHNDNVWRYADQPA